MKKTQELKFKILIENMVKKILKEWEDDVRGEIIGDITFSGNLYYDGRQQGKTLTANSEAELIKMAKDAIKKFKDEFSGFPTYLYPEDKWEFKIKR